MKVAKTFRLDPQLVERAQQRADQLHGGNLTAVMVEALGGLVGVAEEEPAADGVDAGREVERRDGVPSPASAPAPEAQAPPEPTVDLAGWIHGRTDIPLSLVRRFVSTGRVTITGQVYRDLVVPERLVAGGVCLDGLPVD